MIPDTSDAEDFMSEGNMASLLGQLDQATAEGNSRNLNNDILATACRLNDIRSVAGKRRPLLTCFVRNPFVDDT